MVDLGLRGVALRSGWEGKRGCGVAGDGEVEDVLADGSAGAERSEDDRCASRFGGS